MEYLWSTPREVLRREITKVTVRYRKYVEGRAQEVEVEGERYRKCWSCVDVCGLCGAAETVHFITESTFLKNTATVGSDIVF